MNTTTQYAELISALGSSTRLEILLLLVAAYPQGLLSRDLQAKLNLPIVTLSHHLDKLSQRDWIITRQVPEGFTYTVRVETLENTLTFFYVECCERQSLFSWDAIPANKERYLRGELLPRQPERINLESLIDHSIYERLSGKAMQALLLARNESLRLNRNFIGAEEVLLGLMAEGSGIAALALSSWGLELEPARQAIQRSLGLSRQNHQALQFDTRAKLVLSLSLDEATASGHPLINTEHLLLGLIREWQLSQQQGRRLGAAATLLASLSRDPEQMSAQLLGADARL